MFKFTYNTVCVSFLAHVWLLSVVNKRLTSRILHRPVHLFNIANKKRYTLPQKAESVLINNTNFDLIWKHEYVNVESLHAPEYGLTDVKKSEEPEPKNIPPPLNATSSKRSISLRSGCWFLNQNAYMKKRPLSIQTQEISSESYYL